MATRKLKFLFWFSALVLVLACVPTVGAPVSTADPNQINVFIAQTSNAAATRTAAAMPTSTATETPSPTPEDTSTPSATYTSTVIFILSSPTSPVVPTFTGLSSGGGGGSGGGATSSQNYACQVISVEPANGSSLNARADFDAIWRVKNIGQKPWDRNSIDYRYKSGASMHTVAGYDLSSNVNVGNTVSIIVDMEAPNDAGSYTTTWVLRRGDTEFCNMSLTIRVR